MTDTTNRKSWKVEAEKEKALADRYKGNLLDLLDVLTSYQNLTITLRQDARQNSEELAVRAHRKDAENIRWVLEALVEDIELKNIDHEVGDCQRMFDEKIAKREEAGENTEYMSLEKCEDCEDRRKRSNLTRLDEGLRTETAGLLERMQSRSSRRGLSEVKKLLR